VIGMVNTDGGAPKYETLRKFGQNKQTTKLNLLRDLRNPILICSVGIGYTIIQVLLGRNFILFCKVTIKKNPAPCVRY